MILSDLHTHTTFSDGKNTPEEMVIRAIDSGLKTIGISDHSYTPFNDEFCMNMSDEGLYIETINGLKKKYAGKINVLCGIEQDYYSDTDTSCYDYVIGSVHFVKVGNEYISVDKSADDLKNSVDTYFSGDTLAFAELYYSTICDVVEKTNADIIGHFDLISKFNEKKLFDENDPRYIFAWKAAADRLLTYQKPFEINTGAISRGYKSFPYPSPDILNYLKLNGGTFVLSSDSHSKNNIAFQFKKWFNLTK